MILILHKMIDLGHMIKRILTWDMTHTTLQFTHEIIRELCTLESCM